MNEPTPYRIDGWEDKKRGVIYVRITYFDITGEKYGGLITVSEEKLLQRLEAVDPGGDYPVMAMWLSEDD